MSSTSFDFDLGDFVLGRALPVFDFGFEFGEALLALFRILGFELGQLGLHRFVQARLVLAPDRFARLGDRHLGGLKHDRGANIFARPLVDALLRLLRFLHHGFGRRVEFLVELGRLLIAQRLALVEFGLDLFLDRANAFAGTGLDLLALALGFFVQALQRFGARFFVHVGDDVLREVQHPIEIAARNVQQHAQVGWHAAGIPHMRHRRGQFDVAHALAADGGAGDFHAALVANDAAIAHILVLAAIALPVFRRPEDRLAKQAVFLRPQPAIVDRLRLRHFAIRPRSNLIR